MLSVLAHDVGCSARSPRSPYSRTASTGFPIVGKIPKPVRYCRHHSSPLTYSSCARAHASHTRRAFETPLFRFSYQRGLEVALHARGCASSPLHPCGISAASAAIGRSSVVRSPAPHRQDWLPASLSQVRRAFAPGDRVRVAQSCCSCCAMESKRAFQPAALRYSRASTFRCTRLSQSVLDWRSST